MTTSKETNWMDHPEIRRLVHEKRIPFIKWGHYIRFGPAGVARWLDGYRRQPDLSA